MKVQDVQKFNRMWQDFEARQGFSAIDAIRSIGEMSQELTALSDRVASLTKEIETVKATYQKRKGRKPNGTA